MNYHLKLSKLIFILRQHLYGYEALENKNSDLYEIKYLCPGSHKLPINTEFSEFLKEVLENRMKINPSDYSVILNSSPIKNPDNILKIGKMLIEELNFKGFSMVNSACLDLFSTGRTTGIVMNCGEARSYIVPIYEVI